MSDPDDGLKAVGSEEELGALTVKVPLFLPDRAGGPLVASCEHFLVLAKHFFGRRRLEPVHCVLLARTFFVQEPARVADLATRLMADAGGGLAQHAVLTVYGEPTPRTVADLSRGMYTRPNPVGEMRLAVRRHDFVSPEPMRPKAFLTQGVQTLLQLDVALGRRVAAGNAERPEILQAYCDPRSFAQAFANCAPAPAPAHPRSTNL